MNETATKLMDTINAATAPPMAKKDALEVLKELESEIESRIEALEDEIAAG
jgi:uncharacterized small protein (DUF1192 family)